MIDRNAGFGMHTAMSKNGTMVVYKGFRNSLYESGFGLPNYNLGIFQYGFNDGCCHHHHSCGNDSSFEKALLFGMGGGLAIGLGIAFAKPIGKAFTAVGNGIVSAAKWCWNGIKSLFSKKSSKNEKVETAEQNKNVEKNKEVEKKKAAEQAEKAE